jgi:two-component system, chemotaxis family, protein-glutamate methylesterase/glutaminase
MVASNFFIVGIGASAGGHDALKKFFKHLRTPEFPVAFVVVVHLARGHKSILDEILSKYTTLKVKKITGPEYVTPGFVYVIPEDSTLTLREGMLILKRRSADDLINKSVDIFFESLAFEKREQAIGIILSGMGSDGANGVNSIHRFGGTVVVQHPATTQMNGMPISAIIKDHPDEILTPEQIGEKLMNIIEEKIQATLIKGK